MDKIFKDYGLSIVLFLLFLSSWIGQAGFQWMEFVGNQEAHNQSIEIGEYINEFMSATLENWQSEFLQLLTFVILTSFLIHKNSHESKDSDEEMKKILLDVQKKVSNSR